MKRIGLFLILAACGGGSSSSSPAAAPAVPPQPDACVGDAPWLVAILGELPSKSDYINVDHGAQNPQLRTAIDQGAGREVDGDSTWLRNVRWSSQEIYEYKTGRVPSQKVVVARNVQGKDPRTIGDFGQPPALAAPQRLSSGVVEWPSALPSKSDGHFLYVFPDNTWVIVETWMAPRFHAVFSGSSASPPMPAIAPDLYVEYCFPHSGKQEIVASKTNGLDIGADHWVMRIKSNLTAELSYTFDTPDEAMRAEADQRARCSQHPCSIAGSRVDGRVVRYLAKN